MSKENTYMTVAVPGTKKVSVCSRRIGTRDRLSVIATANSEEVAERIVDALNALQGKLDKLDAPSKRDLEISKAVAVSLQRKLTDEETGRNKVRRENDELRTKVYRLEDDLRRTKLALEAAQKPAKENA